MYQSSISVKVKNMRTRLANKFQVLVLNLNIADRFRFHRIRAPTRFLSVYMHSLWEVIRHCWIL